MKNNDQVYTVLKGGYYRVSASMIHYKPTGKFHEVPNLDRRWFEFWKPKTVTQEIYEQVGDMSGTQIKFYNKGEVIYPPPFERL